MAEGGIKPKHSNIQVSKFQLEVNECLGNWLVYLQVSVLFMSFMLKYAKTNYFL